MYFNTYKLEVYLLLLTHIVIVAMVKDIAKIETAIDTIHLGSWWKGVKEAFWRIPPDGWALEDLPVIETMVVVAPAALCAVNFNSMFDPDLLLNSYDSWGAKLLATTNTVWMLKFWINSLLLVQNLKFHSSIKFNTKN